ncbi:hypothetical protein BCR44DRAFT_1513085 [Catenaria anguillulae PL171]|uniref:SEC7 domain-containing protein n=1 Tax=Catenaria anguillulae PL171 TaxID=765915 RepID=A0A1Y2HNR5_9FUNG|nr:hypothetical protein BCR44DRAFT_1513085 [Catenaria anguillulae PL171]
MSIAPSAAPMTISTAAGVGEDRVICIQGGHGKNQLQGQRVIVDSAIAPPEDATLPLVQQETAALSVIELAVRTCRPFASKLVAPYEYATALSATQASRKAELQYLEKFNHGEPKTCVAFDAIRPLCDCFDTDALAHLVSFFTRNRGKLDRSRLGELFGHPDPLCVTLMRAYINSLEFTGMDFVRALRTLLTHFRLPGEAQKIDRILDQFAVAYHANNPGVFKDAGTAFVLSFSLIMLNTDAHNPAVKRKMSVTDFVRNNRGIDAGGDLPAALLRRLYYEIVCHEISMDNDESGRTAKVLKGLVGAEKVRSAYLGQYLASKVIRGTKHERRLFLFASHLLVAKPKMPKHQVSQIFELTSISVSKYADDCTDAPFPNTVAVQMSSPSGISSNAESNTSPGSTYSSDPYLAQTGGEVEHLQLAFESSEERDVFVSNVQQATQVYLQELESIEKYISDRVALTKANLERRYRSLTAAPVMDHPPTIDNSSAYTSPEGTLVPNRPTSAAPTATTTLSVTPASSSPSSAAGAVGSLRAKRMAMQRDAARTAQTLQQTRSMLQSRANSAAVSGRSSLQGSAQNLLPDGPGAASGPLTVSATTANSPTTTSPKFGSAGSVNNDEPSAAESQTQAPRGRPATASAATGATRRGSTASSIFRMSRSPSPAVSGLSPGTANIPRSPSANGYFLSLPSRIIGTLSRRNRVGSARGANNLGPQDDEVGSPNDDDDASSIASGGAADRSPQQQPVFRTRYGSQKGLTMEETIPEMSSRRESTACYDDKPNPSFNVDSESRDTLSTTQSSSPPPESNNASGSLWGRRRANSESRRGTIA